MANWHPVDLAAEVFSRLLERARVPHDAVDAVVIGCASQVGAQSGNIARRVWLSTGRTERVPAVSLECHAASSAQAVVLAAQNVRVGASQLALAGGVEVMSAVPLGAALGQPTLGKPAGQRLYQRYGGDYPPPGLVAEEVACRYSLRRGALDAWAFHSYKKAGAAQRRRPSYLLPVPQVPTSSTLVEADEALKQAPSRASLKTLLPAYLNTGVTTAGNLAAEGDGVSGVVLASGLVLRELGVQPLARLAWWTSVGGSPDLWPLATVPATMSVLRQGKLRPDDIDWWYVHESSAAAVLAWAMELGVPLDKVNPQGGELATRSPLGAVGAGLFASAAACLVQGRGERVGLCVAGEGGVAVASVLERARL